MHSMPDFCGSWRGIKTRVERQTTTSSHVRVRHPWETCSFTPFSASVSSLNQQIFTYFVQRSFLSSCYHFNLKQAFKVNNLVPMTMHHGRCQLVACPLSSQRSRMLMQKRPLLKLTISRRKLKPVHVYPYFFSLFWEHWTNYLFKSHQRFQAIEFLDRPFPENMGFLFYGHVECVIVKYKDTRIKTSVTYT